MDAPIVWAGNAHFLVGVPVRALAVARSTQGCSIQGASWHRRADRRGPKHNDQAFQQDTWSSLQSSETIVSGLPIAPVPAFIRGCHCWFSVRQSALARARASCNPAIVRSQISSRSNSAKGKKFQHQFPFGRPRINWYLGPTKTRITKPSHRKIVDRVYQVTKIAAETVKVPIRKRVAERNAFRQASNPAL